MGEKRGLVKRGPEIKQMSVIEIYVNTAQFEVQQLVTIQV